MYKYFKLSEFDSPDRPGSGELMEHEVVQALDIARDIYGYPMVISSGFRSVEHNRTIGGSPKSSHLLGWAADIAISNSHRRYLLVEALLDAGFTRLGISEDFVHVDMDPNKTPKHCIWTY